MPKTVKKIIKQSAKNAKKDSKQLQKTAETVTKQAHKTKIKASMVFALVGVVIVVGVAAAVLIATLKSTEYRVSVGGVENESCSMGADNVMSCVGAIALPASITTDGHFDEYQLEIITEPSSGVHFNSNADVIPALEIQPDRYADLSTEERVEHAGTHIIKAYNSRGDLVATYRLSVSYILSEEDRAFLLELANDQRISFEFGDMTDVEESSVVDNDGIVVHTLSKIVACIPDQEYAVDANGYLRNANGSLTTHDSAYWAGGMYDKYGAVRCYTRATGTYHIPQGYVAKFYGRGETFYGGSELSNGAFSMKAGWLYFANGKLGTSLYENQGKLVVVLDTDGHVVEKWYIKLVPTLSATEQKFMENWMMIIKK